MQAWFRHRRWLCSKNLSLHQRFAYWMQYVASVYLWCAGGLLLLDRHVQALHRFDLSCHRAMLGFRKTPDVTWPAWFQQIAKRIRARRRSWHMR
eukprot:1236322-Amphidinium_carterae.1